MTKCLNLILSSRIVICSPFVQLLQDLRTRKVPKVGYPTLGAFAEFVSEFDEPSGSSSKNKDTSVLDTGRPFSPAMFEGILKNFTPDVPTSILGRLRQEDAQEFLSFIMDQMHDELLKLEGQPLSINGLKSSLVSSAEEDEWETVGPKNTSAERQTFFREGWVTIKEHYVRPPRWWKEFHLQDGRRLIVINLLQLPPALY
ncbi:unnamed protein product [Prunus armeniaca]|uniref:Peptidase C19 ubiquitin carboxyl-terminal hydrolase domain-containing protein n=1 Tax=Prunus armeniaca TaxID=36596 RepID=A0A6J5VFR5_PRUAR|nr:unnamed protein product [Prunus armeniaca]